MLTAKIQSNNKETLVHFPCTKRALATKLSRIGIQTPTSKLSCETKPESEVKISISADEPRLQKLASLANKASSLESVNSVCAMFEEMPLNAQAELPERAEGGEIESFSELARNVYMYKPTTVSEKYYCPLAVLVYDDYDGYYSDYDGDFASKYESAIREKLDLENDVNMEEYFDGSNSAVSKLRSVVWGVEDIKGVLYGCITAELTDHLTESEKEELKDWICGQNSDGFGEGFEQRPIRISEGEMYVSFWNSSNEYFIYDEKEMQSYLKEQNQSFGMEGLWYFNVV